MKTRIRRNPNPEEFFLPMLAGSCAILFCDKYGISKWHCVHAHTHTHTKRKGKKKEKRRRLTVLVWFLSHHPGIHFLILTSTIHSRTHNTQPRLDQGVLVFMQYNTQHSSLLESERGLMGKVQDTDMGGLGWSSVVRIHRPDPERTGEGGGGGREGMERKRDATSPHKGEREPQRDSETESVAMIL